MASTDSNKVEVQNENDISTSEMISTNNDQNPSISTVAKVDEKTVVSSEISTRYKALYSFCKENSIVNALTVGEVGILEIQEEIRDGVYGITLLPNSAEPDFDTLMGDLAVVPEEAKCSNRRPNIGDILYGLRMDEDWVRGYIVSELPFLKMAIVDEAIVSTIDNVATCDKEYADICAFGAICEVTDAKHKFEEGNVCEFEVTNKERSGFEILILKEEMNVNLKIKATVKPWIPTPEQIGVPCAEVNNGTEVCVTGYQNHIYLFVRSLDTAGLEYYNHVMQTVAKCAETSPFLKDRPTIGDMVIAQSDDGNYYRAYVTRVGNGRIKILYLDLGRKEFTDMKKLKILPDNLKELGYCMTKVVLKDVPRDIPLFKEIDDYLADIVANKVPLFCTYDGIPTIDGVYLKYPDGESVNNKICKILKKYLRKK